MANHSLSMLVLRRILQLKQQAHSNRKISQVCGLSRDTVNLYMLRINATGKSPIELLSLEDEHLAALLSPAPVAEQRDDRYGALMALMPHFSDELNRPHVTRRVIWEDYRKEHLDGYGYTQFCEYLSRYLHSTDAVMHLEHKPGEELYFDFAGDKTYYYNETGAPVACPLFISILPFSGYTFAKALACEKRDQLLHGMNGMVHFYGGVAQSTKGDNMRQYVISSNRYEPTFNELILQWSCHYNTTLLATRGRSPRDKASVESAVNSVYHRIYPYLRDKRPRSLQELNTCIEEALNRFNATKIQNKDYSRKEAFERWERHTLRPLPDSDFVPKTTVQAKVARNYHVRIGPEQHYYSVPYTWIGQRVKVVYDVDHVEVYHGH